MGFRGRRSPSLRAMTSKALKSNSKLHQRHLWNNNIGVDGATALAEALKNSNATLQSLDLRFNKMEDEGTAAIAEALKTKFDTPCDDKCCR